jgi:hypothetical protein
MRGKQTATDVAALLRARNSLLWIVTKEEARAERLLFEACAAAGYVARTWDVGQGACNLDGSTFQSGLEDPGAMLAAIKQRAQFGGELAGRSAWIMRDLHEWLKAPVGITTLRQLRNLARMLPETPRETAQAIIVVSPSTDIPLELAGHATVIEFPLPDRDEIAGILDATIAALPDEYRATAAPNGTRDAAIDAAVGLSGEEAQSCYAKSLVQFKRIDPAAVAGEKKRVIAREGLLEWIDPLPGGLESVGGLESLKDWLRSRKGAYTPQARAYGLPAPRGCLLVGVPGCGKSLTAKAVASAWGVPLLRLDLGALKSKYIGESEGNIRRAFRVIEAIGRCVVWLDEIEKALQGATSGSADGGVSSDALGAVLTWMQDRQGPAFIVATANDIEALPETVIRKGRLDAVFFVDAPNAAERVSILRAALRSHGRGAIDVDEDAVSRASDGFTGSEVASLVPEAMFTAFNDGAREVSTADLLACAAGVVPLTKTAAEKIGKLRGLMQGRAIPASKVEATQSREGRALDM